MLYIFLTCLIVSTVFAFLINHKNILSVYVLGHFSYVISAVVLLINSDIISYEISWKTIVLIISTLFFLGAGEFFTRNTHFKICKRVYFPSDNDIVRFIIPSSVFYLSILVIFVLLIYNYYKFNVVGSYLGGTDFASKYLLIRTLNVDAENGVQSKTVAVPLSGLMAYLRFFVEILVYFYFYLFLYNKCYHVKNYKRNNYWNIVPLLLYFIICVFLINRSEFIKVFSVVGIMYFIFQKQSDREWNNSKSTIKIVKYGSFMFMLFLLIFALIGSLKNQKVDEENVGGLACAYIGAPVIGLDRYIKGEVKKESEYLGQETFRNFYSVLNRLGCDFKQTAYHQDFYEWGKYGQESNLFSSPYYFMLDFPIIIVLFIYFFIGAVLSGVLYGIKFGYYKVSCFGAYVMFGLLCHSILTMSISESLHNYVGTVLVYQLISIAIIDKYLVKKRLIIV